MDIGVFHERLGACSCGPPLKVSGKLPSAAANDEIELDQRLLAGVCGLRC